MFTSSGWKSIFLLTKRSCLTLFSVNYEDSDTVCVNIWCHKNILALILLDIWAQHFKLYLYGAEADIAESFPIADFILVTSNMLWYYKKTKIKKR